MVSSKAKGEGGGSATETRDKTKNSSDPTGDTGNNDVSLASSAPKSQAEETESEADDGEDMQAAVGGSGRKRRFFFFTGVSLGVLLMAFLNAPHTTKLTRLMKDNEFLTQYIQNFHVPSTLTTVRDQLSSIMPMAYEREAAPGIRLAKEGLHVKHPVILLPGITSTTLEVWKGDPCAQKYFRQRIWGTMAMVQQFLMDTKCWLRHIELDDVTGLDPEGVKIRSSLGFEAADYVFGGYWVWAKVIENLAAVGYEPNSMFMASYDWRLSFVNLEVRDQFFTRLKWQVEHMVESQGEKVVFVAHSMGTNVYHYFSQWVTVKHDKYWMDKHVIALVNIGGPMLGLPKALSAMFSGESQEFRELGTLGLAMQQYMNQTQRIHFFRNIASVASMLPRGNNVVWGSDAYQYPSKGAYKEKVMTEELEHGADMPGDVGPGNSKLNGEGNFTNFFVFQEGAAPNNGTRHMFGIEDGFELVREDQHRRDKNHWIPQQYDDWYSHGIALTEREMKERKSKPASWTNILESPLPYAPNLRIYCIHGVNRPSERQYFYKRNDNTGMLMVNTSAQGDYAKGGIGYSDGDGSVPLLSLGAACSYFWKKKLWNPSGTKVVTRELFDEPSYFQDPGRGGPKSGDHVDSMGNHFMIEDVVRVASGQFDLPDRIFSDVGDIAKQLEKDLGIV